MVNEEELAVIDKLIDLGSQNAGDLNYDVVLSLYKWVINIFYETSCLKCLFLLEKA